MTWRSAKKKMKEIEEVVKEAVLGASSAGIGSFIDEQLRCFLRIRCFSLKESMASQRHTREDHDVTPPKAGMVL